MKARLVCKFDFNAAHWLPSHQGKCGNMHGHLYQVEVGLVGEVKKVARGHRQPDEGMVLDFGLLKTIFDDKIDRRCDHQILNKVLPVVPTAELTAGWILVTLRKHFGTGPADFAYNNIEVEFVRVWETPTSCAEVRSEDVRDEEVNYEFANK